MLTCSSRSMSSAGVRTTSSLSPSESCPKRSASSAIFSETRNLINKRTHTMLYVCIYLHEHATTIPGRERFTRVVEASWLWFCNALPLPSNLRSGINFSKRSLLTRVSRCSLNGAPITSVCLPGGDPFLSSCAGFSSNINRGASQGWGHNDLAG